MKLCYSESGPWSVELSIMTSGGTPGSEADDFHIQQQPGSFFTEHDRD